MVRLDFAGSPESNPYDDTTEDAFYYIDPQENTRFEPQLARLGSTVSVGCFNVEQQFGESTAVVDVIKFIDKEGFVAPGNPPAYNSSHEYSVVVDLGQPVRRISIAHADCGFWDNSGNYTVRVTPVESVHNSTQMTSIENAFKIKGIGLVDRFANDPAASVDTDADGYPDDWNTNASPEQIAQSALALDAFPHDPAAANDSDGDGYPDNWNKDASSEDITQSNLALDAFPNDPAEWVDFVALIERHHFLGLLLFVVFVLFSNFFEFGLNEGDFTLAFNALLIERYQDESDDDGNKDDCHSKVFKGYCLIKPYQ